ncbi:ankyrin repeat domain-containing protein [Spiroplasma poulsonii]|uniref:ankyrin repeat domain-containing protein n=1 Tax=Spiroplasma poulsonii TaxID=2138 RepID=UPI000D633C72|nr:ankyrin repeat domain-containing protein [Spiroplasma poulsonii]AWJ64281.1 truncated Spaid [synthetic construct]PWF94104.1 Ankyrin repeat protein [Spiroplasma poulsonii]
MKKLLSLLSVLTISGTAVPTTIAANPYQKQEKLNNNLNYQQTNNLEKLIRNKRNNEDKNYSTWFQAAANGEKKKIIDLIKNYREELINSVYKNNYTALALAVLNNHIDIVKLLIENGAEINFGVTTWVNYVKNANSTPLILASQNGHTEIVKLLIENGAEINHKNQFGNTPLILASQNGHTEIVKLLIENGAKINHKNQFGNTPLILASQNGHTEIVKLLIENWPYFNIKNDDNFRTFQLAEKLGHWKIVDLFLKHMSSLEVNHENNNDNHKKLKTENNNIYYVVEDGSCLFWSVATPYLLQVRNNIEEFKKRFIKLFGNNEKVLINLEYIRELLLLFDLSENSNSNQFWYSDQTANCLIRDIFRNRVVDYMQEHLDVRQNYRNELTLRNIIDSNDIENYLFSLRETSTWGGTSEIIAMSNFLNNNIIVHRYGSQDIYESINQNSNDQININFVNGNHYNFSLTTENIRMINEINLNQDQLIIVNDKNNYRFFLRKKDNKEKIISFKNRKEKLSSIFKNKNLGSIDFVTGNEEINNNKILNKLIKLNNKDDLNIPIKLLVLKNLKVLKKDISNKWAIIKLSDFGEYGSRLNFDFYGGLRVTFNNEDLIDNRILEFDNSISKDRNDENNINHMSLESKNNNLINIGIIGNNNKEEIIKKIKEYILNNMKISINKETIKIDYISENLVKVIINDKNININNLILFVEFNTFFYEINDIQNIFTKKDLGQLENNLPLTILNRFITLNSNLITVNGNYLTVTNITENSATIIINSRTNYNLFGSINVFFNCKL